MWKYNGKEEEVPIGRVYEEYTDDRRVRSKRQFVPRNVHDFLGNILYIVKSAQDLPEGEEDNFYAEIGKLAETQLQLHGSQPGTSSTNSRNTRTRWGVIRGNQHNLDPPDTNESEPEAPHSGDLLSARQKKKKCEERRHGVNIDDLNVYLSNKRCLETPVRTTGKLSTESANDLKERIRVLEKQLEEERAKATQRHETEDLAGLKTYFSEQFSKLTQKFEDFKGETFATVSSILSKMEATQGLISNNVPSVSSRASSGTTYASTSGISSNPDEEVEYACGLTCKRKYLENLKVAERYHTTDHTMWAKAMLRCAFEVDADRYAKKPQTKSGKLPFPEELAPQHQHRVKLPSGKMATMYSDIKKQSLCDSLMLYLSRVAVEMNGARGVNAKIKVIIAARGDPAPLCEEQKRKREEARNTKESNEAEAAAAGLPVPRQRKKYIRRGAPEAADVLLALQQEEVEPARSSLIAASIRPTPITTPLLETNNLQSTPLVQPHKPPATPIEQHHNQLAATTSGSSQAVFPQEATSSRAIPRNEPPAKVSYINGKSYTDLNPILF